MAQPYKPKKHSGQSDEADFRGRTRDRVKRAERTRTRIKQSEAPSQVGVRGIASSPIGPQWIVAVNQEFWICTVSGVVDTEHLSTLVVVGDNVVIEPDPRNIDSGDRLGVIVGVEPRTSVLSRKAAGKVQREQVLVANVEQICIVMSAALPNYNKRLIDRYLIAADKGDLTPIIVINKFDLVDSEFQADIEDDLRVYSEQLSLPVIFTSAQSGSGLAELVEILSSHSTLFAGPSGVGKSTLINRITDARQRVGAISEKFEKGTHTTTASIVIPLPNGGRVVDSPGIREFGIWELSNEELPFYFEEFADFTPQCKFSSCSHTHEPNCAVKDAVERGEIDQERYVSYLVLRSEED